MRLVHTLSLLLVSAVLLTVLAMGSVAAWNLQTGFAGYIAAREAERLEAFADYVADQAQRHGGNVRELNMHQLLRGFGRLEGERDGLREQGQLDPEDEPELEEPLPRQRPPGGRDAFGARVMLLTPDGAPLLGALPGRSLPPKAGPYIERPIRIDTKLVAIARMRMPHRVPDAVASGFLYRQYGGIVALSLLLVGLALLVARWLSRRWVRPLLAVQAATARIARGEFGVRIDGNARRDELGDLIGNLNHMAQSLQQLEGARRRWMAEISHELRTPLAVLRGEIDALLEGVRPLQPSAIRSLSEEVMHLTARVEDLHLLSMSDLKVLSCNYLDIDAAALLRGLVERNRHRAEAAGFALQLDAPDLLPVHWDPQRIEQLLANLLENSLRYTDAPGRIELQLAMAGDHVVLNVNDSAPGVPEADLPRLFEPLYRADAARSRHTGGSGLGLAICAALAHSHGGEIHARRSPLGGLNIEVQLPRVAGLSAGASA